MIPDLDSYDSVHMTKAPFKEKASNIEERRQANVRPVFTEYLVYITENSPAIKCGIIQSSSIITILHLVIEI